MLSSTVSNVWDSDILIVRQIMHDVKQLHQSQKKQCGVVYGGGRGGGKVDFNMSHVSKQIAIA